MYEQGSVRQVSTYLESGIEKDPNVTKSRQGPANFHVEQDSGIRISKGNPPASGGKYLLPFVF